LWFRGADDLQFLIVAARIVDSLEISLGWQFANVLRCTACLIEVQSGAYLGEDDIVRFEDRYGRLAK